MTLPAENQQTVEAALDNAGEPGVDFPSHIMDDARAALRDLVAQAELAHDMGAALRRHQAMGYAPGEDVQMRRELEDLLARLDGAR